MKWTAPKIVELSVGMEINMYASATGSSKPAMRQVG
ncbi:pyrroloquinoline quinone precursor peptide PqqA [Bradyrhizobium ottawaense]